MSAKNSAGLTKKEKAKLRQQAEDMGMLDVLFALAAIQLRFGRRDIAMLYAVDHVLKALKLDTVLMDDDTEWGG